jgi:ADP-heptose:LPS heptosyltransferase
MLPIATPLCPRAKEQPFPSEKQAVVVHQGALGDFLLALPVIEGLARAVPGLSLVFWLPNHHIPLLHGKHYVTSAFDSGGREWAPLFHEDQWRKCALPLGMETAQAIYLFGQVSSGNVADRLRKRAQTPVFWFRSFPRPEERRHTTDFLEDQARAYDLPLEMGPFRLIPDPNTLAEVRKRLGQEDGGRTLPRVVIHAGSGGFRKLWPLRRWRSLLHWLYGRGDVRVIMIVGPADERVMPLAREAKAAFGALVLEEMTLPALGALLHDADLYIGNDSGVTHLAASMGSPAIAIFGPTDPLVWGPRGASVEFLRDLWSENEILDPQPTPQDHDSESRLRAMVAARLP